MNRVIVDSRLDRDVLIGYCDRNAFQHSLLQRSFEEVYFQYEPRLKTIEMLRKLDEPWTATVIMASWCGDSQREIPRFYRVLDETGVEDARITLIALDRDFNANGVDVEGLEIERVPTFIFYKGRKEVGRIVENVRQTMEDDMLLILSTPGRDKAPENPFPINP